MAAWRYEISLLVLKKYFTRSLRLIVKYFSTLEEKFRTRGHVTSSIKYNNENNFQLYGYAHNGVESAVF